MFLANCGRQPEWLVRGNGAHHNGRSHAAPARGGTPRELPVQRRSAPPAAAIQQARESNGSVRLRRSRRVSDPFTGIPELSRTRQ
jgi:hypothetical protein